MAKKARREEDKKTKKGDTFYETIPAVRMPSGELHLPKIKPSTADFLESIIIFFAGTVEILLLMRIVLMTFGVSGDSNLLTYLLYAVSYPFVAVLNSGQGQVSAITSDILYENIALMVIYFVIFYVFLKVVRGLKIENNRSNND
jgi:predicted neutral ceramidase superfamily lipid hydrolase